jgi:tryptophan 6-halogenase
VGLSSSFVEPLESTAIFAIQYALLELLNHLPAGEDEEHMRASFNRAVGRCIDGIRDFLILHYYCNRRRDTDFWRATKEDAHVPEQLKESVALWRYRLPNPTNVNQSFHGFYPFSYTVMMLGLSGGPVTSHPLFAYLDPGQADYMFTALRRQEQDLCRSLPSHQEYLDALYKGELDEGQSLHANSAVRQADRIMQTGVFHR